MHATHMVILQLLVWITLAASYIMDDTNQTIVYAPPGRWQAVSCDTCHDGTETYNPFGCNTTDNCQMQIPFVGSGITLYMTLIYTTNFTVSIDGSTPIRSQFLAPPTMIFNFTAYDHQSLTFGPHTLDLGLLDANETADDAHNSNFLFDYAVINDEAQSTGPAPSSGSTASSPTPSGPTGSTTRSSPSSSSNPSITQPNPANASSVANSSPPSPSSVSNSTTPHSGAGKTAAIAIPVSLGVIAVVAFIALVIILLKKRRSGLNNRHRGAELNIDGYTYPSSQRDCQPISEPMSQRLPEQMAPEPLRFPPPSMNPRPSIVTKTTSPSVSQASSDVVQHVSPSSIARMLPGLSERDVDRIAESLAQRLRNDGEGDALPDGSPPRYETL